MNSDVVFRVRTDGKTEDIKALRAILGARSPVFATMFYGSLPEKKTVVEITDTSPEVFRTMLRYLYIDDTSRITKENIVDVYSLAHKYAIESLKSVCADKTKDCATMENIGELLAMNDVYEDAVFDANCRSFIKANAWKLFQKEENYKDLPQKHLIYIWQHDTHSEGPNKLPEMDIYSGAITWAKAECERQGIPADDPKNRRQVLGPPFQLTSFARMTMQEFHNIATRGSLLTWEETVRMTFYLVNVELHAALPFGRPAVFSGCVKHATSTERICRSDGRLVEVQRSFLEDAIAGKTYKSTCGCDCKVSPKIVCSVQRGRCTCDCYCFPKTRCRFQAHQIALARSHRCSGRHFFGLGTPFASFI